jgi:hypothetical protein
MNYVVQIEAVRSRGERLLSTHVCGVRGIEKVKPEFGKELQRYNEIYTFA